MSVVCRRPLLARPVFVAALAALACVSLAAKLPKLSQGERIPVSMAPGGTMSDGDSLEGSVSSNGRYVAFFSDAGNLGPTHETDRYDVYVRDRKTDTAELISRRADGAPGNNDSYFPTLSGNGRYVLYHTSATDIVAISGTSPGSTQAVLYDRKKKTSRLISAAPNGDAADGTVDLYDTRPLSANGRWAVFTTDASNLFEGDDNEGADLFLADTRKGTITRIPEGLAEEPDGGFYSSSISPNGRYVVFISDATNLATDDDNGRGDVFLYDVRKKKLELVSRALDGGVGDGRSDVSAPAVDNRGRFVAFGSAARNLTEEDVPGSRNEVFLRDMRKGTTTWISRGPNDVGSDANAGDIGITPNGQMVLFWTRASNLVDTTDTIPYDQMIYDVKRGELRRVLPATDGGAPDGGTYGYFNGISANGKWFCVTSQGDNITDVDARGAWDVFLVRLK